MSIDSVLDGEVSLFDEVKRVLENEGQAILRCVERLAGSPQREQLEKAVMLFKDALESGGKVVVTGVGKSGKIGQKIAATLSSTGSLAVFLHPTEGLHGDLGILQSRDTILALSHSGNTEELVRLIPSLKSRKIPIVGIGGNPESKLAAASDAWIDARIEQEACPHNLAPTTSTTLALALGDAIAVALMRMRGFTERSFAENHPGGTLGRKLNSTVGDLMHPAAEVGQVGLKASMDEVVITSTQKKLGGIVVLDGTRLIGLITDGDIRRALRAREGFFQLTAEEVMTRSPITVRTDTPAVEALRLMEKRESQISVLPVVDINQQWKGLLRLHDIVGNI